MPELTAGSGISLTPSGANVIVAATGGSPGGGYATRTAMASRAAPALLDNVYLTEAGRFGRFVVEAASSWTAQITADTQQGVLVVSTTDATKVYVRKFDGPHNLSWFGLTGGGSTDNLAVWNGVKAYFSSLPASGYYDAYPSLYRPFPKLWIPKGHYRFSAPVQLDGGRWDIECDGAVGAQNGSYSVAFKMDAGNDGIVAQSWNTTGVNGSKTTRADSYGAQGSTIRGLFVYTTGAGGSTTACGFYSRTRIILIDCGATNFPADGACIAATAGGGGSSEGNANCSQIVRGHYFQNGGMGVRFVGADVNASGMDGTTCNGNGQYGCSDEAFLDIHPSNLHFSTNGMVGSGASYAANTRGAMCTDGTYRYYLIDGQDTAASTTAPTSGTSNAVWALIGSGGATAFYITWTTAQTWKSGGAVRNTKAATQTVWRDCYAESDNAPAQLGAARWDGGLVGCLVIGALTQSASGSVRLAGSALAVINPDLKTTVAMGQANLAGAGLVITNTDYDTSWGSWVLGYNSFYHDLLLYRSASAAKSPYRITTDQTIFNPGRAATVPNRMVFPEIFVGVDNSARSLTWDSAAPTTGDHGRGDIVFNNAPSAAGKVGWVCVTAGTPGTWKLFGVIDA